MDMPSLSITTDFTDDGGPIAPKLALFAEAGFTHIHWCEHWARDVLYEDFYMEGVLRELEIAGLWLLDTHAAQTPAASPSSEDEDVRRRGGRLLRNRLLFTVELGGNAVVVHPPSFDEADPAVARKRWDNLARSVEEVAPLCERSGVRLALENMARPLPDAFPKLLEQFSPEVLGFCYDSGHANIAGQPELLEKFAHRLAVLHLHDNHGTKDEHALPGRGTVDWERILRTLHKCGYTKPLNFELSLRDPAFSSQAFVHEAYRLGMELSERLRSEVANAATV